MNLVGRNGIILGRRKEKCNRKGSLLLLEPSLALMLMLLGMAISMWMYYIIYIAGRFWSGEMHLRKSWRNLQHITITLSMRICL
jgi:hypothetical protein